MNDFNWYQRETERTAVYPKEVALEYLTIKLCSEAGEVADLVGKKLRGDPDRQDIKEKLIAELGDVLWYLARLADVHGVTLAQVAEANLEKLLKRQREGKLKGSGDNR